MAQETQFLGILAVEVLFLILWTILDENKLDWDSVSNLKN